MSEPRRHKPNMKIEQRPEGGNMFVRAACSCGSRSEWVPTYKPFCRVRCVRLWYEHLRYEECKDVQEGDDVVAGYHAELLDRVVRASVRAGDTTGAAYDNDWHPAQS